MLKLGRLLRRLLQESRQEMMVTWGKVIKNGCGKTLDSAFALID